jgi:predicted nuclease with RNAse H fold
VDSVVGIDLSGVGAQTVGRTVAARLALGARARLVDLTPRVPRLTDAALLAWIAHEDPRIVAIDAPLTLPHVVSCTDPICSLEHHLYTRRLVEIELRDRMHIGMATSRIAAIAFRGIYLKRSLTMQGIQVIETYPRATFQVLGVPTTSKRDPAGAAAALGRRVDGVATTDADELDAIAAALAAAEYLQIPRPKPIRAPDGEIWIALPD